MTQPLLIHTEASHGWGGQEMRTLAECRWFLEQDFEVELIAPPDSNIAKVAVRENIPVHYRNFTKSSQFSDFLFCKKLFASKKPLMVGSHSNIDSRVCLIAARLSDVKNRFRYRHVSIPVKNNPWNQLLYRYCATQVITTAEKIAKPLRHTFKISDDKVITVSTGIKPPSDLPSRKQAHADLCQELGLPETSEFIGQISILRSWKGHKDVMKAFEMISKEFPNYHLVFIGGGHGEKYLPPIAESLSCKERIHFLGHKPNPWPYFRALKIATLASTGGEGIPQSAMQAMLCGTAFVGTTIGGIPEIINDEVNGLLVPPSDPNAIAKSIQILLSDTAKLNSLTEKAQIWAESHTTLDIMGKKIMSLLIQ